jgi:hypothetical protein
MSLQKQNRHPSIPERDITGIVTFKLRLPPCHMARKSLRKTKAIEAANQEKKIQEACAALQSHRYTKNTCLPVLVDTPVAELAERRGGAEFDIGSVTICD